MNKLKVVGAEFLSVEEETERLRLERQVERAFYQAGLALQTLRDKKLYRSTHKTFQEYCQDRFGFAKSHSYRLINAVEIVDNISEKVPNWGQNETKLIFPTTESQVRPLKSLEPSLQRQAWTEAVEIASGVPSAKIVREVVKQIQRQSASKLENSSKTKSKIEVDKNGKVSSPSEGINHVSGVGIEWYVRLDEPTWHKLNEYAEKTGTATLNGAIARLLAENLV